MSGMKHLGTIQASDNILHLAWDAEGARLAIAPSTGEIPVIDCDGNIVEEHDGNALGNAAPAWFGGHLATAGFDGRVRFGDGREVRPGRGIIERLKTSPDGKLLAVGQAKHLHIFDKDGATTRSLPELPSQVADFVWNPANASEIAVAGAGGARMWRSGEAEPFARFDWGGASLLVDWSPCGRWLVTADQTASVHLYDFTRDYPLHIQGFETKVQAMAFSADGSKLATGGGPVITVWPTTGESGPEGITPVQLDGHDSDMIAAAFSPVTGQLATGDETGTLLIFTFQDDKILRKRTRLPAGISSLAWHPSRKVIAVGQSDGAATLLSLE